jgi:hypothetical protein
MRGIGALAIVVYVSDDVLEYSDFHTTSYSKYYIERRCAFKK